MLTAAGISFLAGMVFGLALAAPPGPMNAIIAEESVVRGWSAGFKAGLGAMLADVVFFLLALAGALNRHFDGREEYDYRGLRRAIEGFEEFGEGVLGLDFGEVGAIEGEVALADDLVETILGIRERAREAGEYDRADALRAELRDLGVEIEDTAEGTDYRY